MNQQQRIGIVLFSCCLATLIEPIRDFVDLVALIIAGIVVYFLSKLTL